MESQGHLDLLDQEVKQDRRENQVGQVLLGKQVLLGRLDHLAPQDLEVSMVKVVVLDHRVLLVELENVDKVVHPDLKVKQVQGVNLVHLDQVDHWGQLEFVDQEVSLASPVLLVQ